MAAKLLKDPHLREVASGTIMAFALRGLGAGLAFLFNAAIARLLGAEGAGLYFLALSVAMIGSVVARMGLDNTILRFVASGAAEGEWGRVKGIYHLGMRHAGLFSAGLALSSVALAPIMARIIFKAPELTGVLRVMSLAIFTYSMMILLGESLKGLKRIRDSMLVSGVLHPMFGLMLIWPMVSILGAAGASVTYVLATGLSAILGLMVWRWAIPQNIPVMTFPRHELITSSRPLWAMQIINRAILPWLPLFLLGIWGTPVDAGIFGVATRISTLVTFFLVAVNNVLAPKFAELYAKGDMRTLAQLARRFALFITLASSPAFLLLIFGGRWVMSLFGPGFRQGGTALAILAVGQVLNTMTGSVGYLLMMSGHEKDVLKSALFGSVLLGGCAVALIPTHGIIGAAIASAAAVAGKNLMSVGLVWYRLRIVTITFPRT